MIETTSFFDTYNQALKGLQALASDILDGKDFPMCKSIVFGEPMPQQPSYVEQLNRLYKGLDISCIMTPSASLHPGNGTTWLNTSETEWPRPECIILNESQYRAFQLAFTQPLALIQGPPGTGKTFMGIRLVETILRTMHSTDTQIEKEHQQRRRKKLVNSDVVIDTSLATMPIPTMKEVIMSDEGGSSDDEEQAPQRLKLGVEEGELSDSEDDTLTAGRDNRQRTLDSRIQQDSAHTDDVELEKIKQAEMLAHNFGPILVVCYKNHALDQFLSGIVERCSDILDPLGSIPGIIRVGGGCKGKSLSKFSLRECRFKYRAGLDIARTKAELRTVEMNIANLTAQVQDIEFQVCSSTYLQDVIPHSIYQQLKTMENKFCDGILFWLYEGFQFPSTQELADRLCMRTGCSPERSPSRTNTEHNASYVMSADEDYDENAVLEDDLHDKVFRPQVFNHGMFALHIGACPSQTELRIETLLSDPEMDVFQDVAKEARLRFPPEDVLDIHDIWALPGEPRWGLYFGWIREKKQQLLTEKTKLQAEYVELSGELQEQSDEKDYNIFKRAKVVAMTTTGAARYRHVLQRVAPKVVMFEEAAEILESHTIAALSDKTEHVIMIGDHKQLRPTCNVYDLEVHYNLTCSMFERLVNLRLPLETLLVQQRMRPEIASFLVPEIYQSLQNHPCVLTYHPVRGMEHSVFFMTHKELENRNPETTSHSNEFEARMLSGLVVYLLKQGYDESDITVITPYEGQRKFITDVLDQPELRTRRNYDGRVQKQEHNEEASEVQVKTVDNYQGQENKIILLSLVRSNKESKIGHVKAQQRVCVMLSRAKEGLFVIGNLEQVKASSNLWKSVIKKASENGQVGNYFPLRCRSHQEQVTRIHAPKDFDVKAPEGGCDQICGFRSECGHACARQCHTDDLLHEATVCKLRCTKRCANNHPCRKHCWEKCGLCQEVVSKIVPHCGHTQQVECHLPDILIKCKKTIIAMLPCQHSKSIPCHQSSRLSAEKCEELIKHELSCGHTMPEECGKETPRCSIKCEASLSCGHKCKGTCGKCFQGRIHVKCREPCQKTLVCGHPCPATCSVPCPTCHRKCSNKCSHNVCPKACGEPCIRCKMPCEEMIRRDGSKPIKCPLLCYEPCDPVRNTDRCREDSACEKHRCRGVRSYDGYCHDECLTSCRHCDPENETFEVFFGKEDEKHALFLKLECGHTFEVTGLDKWVEQSSADGETAIQLPKCPICKAVITHPRYRNCRLAKQARIDLENVKEKLLDDQRQDINQERLRISESLRASSQLYPRLHKATTLESIINLGNAALLYTSLKQLAGKPSLKEAEKDTKALSKDVKLLIYFVENEVLTSQQLEETALEVRRLLIWHDVERLGRVNFTKEPTDDMKTRLSEVTEKLRSCTKVPDEDLSKMEQLCKELAKFTEGLGITDEEKKLILKAMKSTRSGHWFKCPNGHVYYIGECGGATQESRCNECGASIGGGSHRLRSDNALAPEMDGASHAAYSVEANNMVNWNLDDLH